MTGGNPKPYDGISRPEPSSPPASASGVSSGLASAIKLLHNNGYLVFKIPECKRDWDHGRHGLITRSASCPGKGKTPHGFVNLHLGTFGPWIYCACGYGFSDYDGDPKTDWEKHKEEHDIH